MGAHPLFDHSFFEINHLGEKGQHALEFLIILGCLVTGIVLMIIPIVFCNIVATTEGGYALRTVGCALLCSFVIFGIVNFCLPLIVYTIFFSFGLNVLSSETASSWIWTFNIITILVQLLPILILCGPCPESCAEDSNRELTLVILFALVTTTAYCILTKGYSWDWQKVILVMAILAMPVLWRQMNSRHT